MKQQPENLTGKQLRHLRSLGHPLKPVIQVGKGGITDSFISQLEKILEDHELIKVKVMQNSPVNRNEASAAILEKVPCHVAQSIGKTLLLYQQNGENPVIRLP